MAEWRTARASFTLPDVSNSAAWAAAFAAPEALPDSIFSISIHLRPFFKLPHSRPEHDLANTVIAPPCLSKAVVDCTTPGSRSLYEDWCRKRGLNPRPSV